jgi:hypothetical protein
MTTDFGFERVYVELEWYDGPRAGIADIHGVPHRFKSNDDDTDDDPLGTFSVRVVEPDVLAKEQEQWRIFVAWNRRHEAGDASVPEHPRVGGIDSRYDALERELAQDRSASPAKIRRASAEKEWLDRDERYAEDGPDYRMRWTFL